MVRRRWVRKPGLNKNLTIEYNIPFGLAGVQAVWQLASPILLTWVSGTSQKADSNKTEFYHGIPLLTFEFPVKVRLQTRTPKDPKTMTGTFVNILRGNQGVRGLYPGLSASLLRQLTYSTTRFGVYEELKTSLTKKNDGNPPSGLTLVGIASLSGAIGGLSGNGADICNVRMQGDAALPPERRRNYKHAIDGMLRMAREEGGIRSWFRGMGPNSLRASIMTASQLASYDVFKKMILGWTSLGDGLATHFSASFLAGVVAATVTSPVDVVKTRVMSASHKEQGIIGLVVGITKKEGPMWVFKGWVPSFLRLGP